MLVSYNDKSLNGTLSAFDKYPGVGPGLNVYSSVTVSGGTRPARGKWVS